jgi:hypothetical protein
MAGTARLAATQASYGDVPQEANPFSEVFSPDAAREHARKRMEMYAGQVGEAGSAKADLVVTQEDVANLYLPLVYLDDPSIFRTLVEETSVHVLRSFSDAARRHKMNVVVGLYEPEGDEIINSAVLMGRDGKLIGRYRKVHLPASEGWLVTPGDKDPAVITADVDAEHAWLSPEDSWESVYSGITDVRERRLKLRHPNAYRVLAEPSPSALKAYPDVSLPNTPEAIRAVYEKQKDEYQRNLRGEEGRYHW